MKSSSRFNIPERYKVLSTLGAGGMGIVILAEDLKLIRQVAIKVIRKELISEENMLSRTKLEGQILSKLRHPSLASVYEMDMDAEYPYIVQEYIKGESLGSLIKSGQLFNPRKALRLFREQAMVLQYLHEQSIFHRDIKPDNIMIDHSGKSVLMDFGLALAGDRTRFTEEGNFVGTMRYCPPEVLKGIDGGARADVFQLGLVVLMAMTGESLYGDMNTVDQFLEVVFSGAWEKVPLNEKIPAKLATIIKQTCRFAPEERPANGGELLELIDSVTEKSPAPLKTEETGKGKTTPISETYRREAVKIGEPRVTGSSIAKPSFIVQTSFRRKIALVTILSSLVLLIFCLPFLQNKSSLNSNESTQLKEGGNNLFNSSRAFILTPEGFYLFLPSSSGKDLNWKLKFQGPASRDLSGRFTKVAGGWKTSLRKKGLPLNSLAVLSIYNDDTEIDRKSIQLPESYLKSPLQAIFSHDQIRARWEFHGKAPARIVVHGLGKNSQQNTPLLTKTTETGECSIMTSELGKNREVTLSLYIPGLLPDLPQKTVESSLSIPLSETKVGEISGTCELNLKFHLASGSAKRESELLTQLTNSGEGNSFFLLTKKLKKERS
jgi:serine/threonine protein kinase